MPGIYTHNYIFRKSVEGILKNKNRSYLNRSIETLFATPEHFRAGLFGAIGPNIFDYMYIKPKTETYGHEISFALHDKSCSSYLKQMMDIVGNNKDCRNEWSSVQMSYLLGYISHIVSDSIIHPYIFYSSGFPEKMERREIIYYRRMNLRFQYNLDNFFLYRDESGPVINSLDDMLPVYILNGKIAVWPAIKYLLLESLKREDDPLLRKYFRDLKPGRIDGDTGPVKNFDKIPSGITFCYKMKRTENTKWINIIDKFCDNPLSYSDFFVRYPKAKRIDEDALNIHQGRWQYPANQRGFRYESVLHLIKLSIEQIVKVWELFEPAICGEKFPDMDEMNILDAYTGEKDVFFKDMRIKDPVKMKV